MLLKFSATKLPLSNLVRLGTWCSVAHVEFLFSDCMRIYPSIKAGYVIQNRDNKRWIERLVDLEFTDEQERIIREWAISQMGIKYDFLATIPFIPRAKDSWKDSKYWMCSEFCAYGLELLGYKLFPDDFGKVKPSDLYKKLKQIGTNKNNIITVKQEDLSQICVN